MTSGTNNKYNIITATSNTTNTDSIWYNTTDSSVWVNGIWDSSHGTGTADNDWDQVTWGPLPNPPLEVDWLKNIPIWAPIECTCCGRDIKVQDDGLHLKIGDDVLWFHRQCFVNRKYARFIRSLIVTKDLGIL